MKVTVILVLLLLLGRGVIHASNTDQVREALTTLSVVTAGHEHASSYIAHFCLTTTKAIREGKRGWYSLAQTDYDDLKHALSSEDLSRFKDPLLAFESVFYSFDGN